MDGWETHASCLATVRMTPAADVRTVSCRGCADGRAHVAVDYGVIPVSDYFPPADDAGPDPAFPLTLAMCPKCLLVQLGPVASQLPEEPLAVESATSQAHAERSAAEVTEIEGLAAGASVIELASHHGGSWLPALGRLGLLSKDTDGQADVVVDVHALAHEPDLHGPLREHARRLGPGGTLVLEFHHLLPLVQMGQIDTVRHGHYVYLSLLSLRTLLAAVGLTVTRAVRVPVFGGSLRVTARRASDHPPVDSSVDVVAQDERDAGLADTSGIVRLDEIRRPVVRWLRDYLETARSEGRRVAGYGAPSKAPVLLALADVDHDLLPFVVDRAPSKNGRRLPGTRIPIHAVDRLSSYQPDEILILTWDIADEVERDLSAMWPPSRRPRFVSTLAVGGWAKPSLKRRKTAETQLGGHGP